MSNVLEFPELEQILELPFQTFGVTTYDSLFKHVLDAAEVRPSFFSACIPHLNIRSSTRVDEHMNPFKELENLRHFIDGKEQEGTAKQIKLQEKDLEVFLSGKSYT